MRQETNRIKRFMDSSLAKIQASELRSMDFAQWRDERLKTVLGSSFNRELATLSAICEHAMKEWKLLRDNPVKKISKPANSKERTRRPSQQEIDNICEALLYDPDNKPELGYQRVALAFICH